MPISKRPISTVVFDLGNVMVGWNPHLPFADRMSESEWRSAAEAADFHTLNTLADSGVSIAEVTRRATERNPAHGGFVAHYFEHFEDALTGPVQGVAELVQELKASGMRLLGLKNWSAATYHHAAQSAPAILDLDDVVVSGREGLAKPDRRLFKRMIERHQLAPEQTVFIDDTATNVDVAAALGLVALRFTDAKRLRHDLERIGVMASAG